MKIFSVLKEKLKVYMTVKKLQEMYEESCDVEKLKVSDYLKQYMELKKKYSEVTKFIDDKITDLEKTKKDFNLSKDDKISISIEVYKKIREMM